MVGFVSVEDPVVTSGGDTDFIAANASSAVRVTHATLAGITGATEAAAIDVDFGAITDLVVTCCRRALAGSRVADAAQTIPILQAITAGGTRIAYATAIDTRFIAVLNAVIAASFLAAKSIGSHSTDLCAAIFTFDTARADGTGRAVTAAVNVCLLAVTDAIVTGCRLAAPIGTTSRGTILGVIAALIDSAGGAPTTAVSVSFIPISAPIIAGWGGNTAAPSITLVARAVFAIAALLSDAAGITVGAAISV